MRILVVEDVQETRDAIEGLLDRDGYSVDQAKDEDDAVQRVLSNRPNLILISLAGTSDEIVGVARRIRMKGGLTEEVPVVIFSVTTVSPGAEQEIGGNVYITMPDNFDQLRRLIAFATSRKSHTH